MVTTEDAYVRFHGRNGANWRGQGGGDRYDYDYREDELKEWLRKITELGGPGTADVPVLQQLSRRAGGAECQAHAGAGEAAEALGYTS